MQSEIPDSFSDSKATIADDNFTSTTWKVICTRGGLGKAAHRDPKKHGGCAPQAVGPQATANMPSWADNAHAKRWFNFQKFLVFMLSLMIP